MRVLWLCNMVLNDFTEEFSIRKKPFGGWMDALFHNMHDIEFGFCFPIIDECRMKNSVYNGYKYYSFHAANDVEDYSQSMKGEFETIINDFQPDIIHIWGTEYNHARAMVEAAQSLGIIKKIIVRIQGLVSFFPEEYIKGIPEKYLDIKGDLSGISIRDEMLDFSKRAENERYILTKVSYIYGRGEWDGFFTRILNPAAMQPPVDNILRYSFYDKRNRWELEQCVRHSIFISQAHYTLKGFHFLLKAIKLLKRFYPDIKVNVGGVNLLEMRTGYTRYIQDLIKDLSLDNEVIFLGMLTEKEIIQEYLRSHVSVCPSIVENRSNSMCESMMLGVPTIASFVGGNVGTLTHGFDGFMYPAEDIYSLAGYIDKVFSDDTLAKNISYQGHLTAEKRHDKCVVLAKTKDIYARVFKDTRILS